MIQFLKYHETILIIYAEYKNILDHLLNGQIEYKEIDSQILHIPNIDLSARETIPVKGIGWFVFMSTGHDFYHLLDFDGKLKVKNICIKNKDELNICAGRRDDNLWIGLNFNGYSF